MRFFTPELLKRCRSSGRAEAEPAEAEWDAAIDAYARHLKALRRDMPIAARRALRLPSLHDGELLGYMGERTAPRATMIVRLEGHEGDPGRLVAFRYLTSTPDGKGGIAAEHHDVGAKGDISKHKSRILADEFDSEGDVFAHSVMLSNGLVFRVRFRDVSARLVEPFLVPESLGVGLPDLALA